jgi:hypothetical protein
MQSERLESKMTIDVKSLTVNGKSLAVLKQELAELCKLYASKKLELESADNLVSELAHKRLFYRGHVCGHDNTVDGLNQIEKLPDLIVDEAEAQVRRAKLTSTTIVELADIATMINGLEDDIRQLIFASHAMIYNRVK